ncbi:RnfABCDGE type electron transport complex subunit B [Crateriforma conspicua]|uniref:Ion-translocating oxidoreductase complex subunit B n=1 Tax=Crateriforma conspicua TaxID=2527996 RepID=A0A5C5Y1M0_9PLAN|nr:RnfABCDGE type electron transport complex subunit B [Crateriforma conspicua]QDV63732.1 Electron transport complex protein rnfB [Crateriforma conspicua]TWT69114.1 Electron transport complex protein rnfB [Crateriforma conspicua]
MNVVISVLAIVVLTSLLATLLVVAGRFLHVEEDPRIDEVEDMLPHSNCGACGKPGCRAFAEALVAGDALPSGCTVGSPDDHVKIATFLGVDVGSQQRRVARLACAGGNNVARDRAHYQGMDSCAAAALVAGGGKACFWGCLGLADCANACDFDAITMNQHDLPVVNEDACTACGDCVQACPKDLFSLQVEAQRLWVACSSLAEGDGVLEQCEVGCTACGRCAMDSEGQIVMRDNLPVIQPSSNPLTDTPTKRCPTGAIVWIDQTAGIVKGDAAAKVIRQSEIHDAIT